MYRSGQLAARRPPGQRLAGDYAVSRAKRRTNAAGAALSRQLYYPFGQVRWASESPLPTDFGFAGQREDGSTGLVFMHARFYDPALGRFVQADTIIPNPANPQSLNRYAYVYNNPLRYIDPSGHGICDGPGGELNPDCHDYRTSLPSGRYLYSETYGWFDKGHLHTGDPAGLIADVKNRVGTGGMVFIEQGVQGGTAVYRGYYWISADLTEDEVTGVALGIYMDWSLKFEQWEGTLLFGIPDMIAGGSSFAREDLPSHHIGFFAAANNLSLAEVFEEYLGGVEGTDIAPPPFTAIWIDPAQCPSMQCHHLQDPYYAPIRLRNHEFTPLVPTGETMHGWSNIPWPSALQITPIESSSGLWGFSSEETECHFSNLLR